MDIDAFWRDVLSQDKERLPAYFHENAVVRWHCTGEQFTASEYIRANCAYPGSWDGAIERLEHAGNTAIFVGRVWPEDQSASFHVVSFLTIKDGKIWEMDEYWADDGEAPAWRRSMRIGKPLSTGGERK